MKWRATKILKERRSQSDEETLLRLSIAGFTNDFTSGWHKQVEEIFNEKDKVRDPYVRAMLGFLVEKYEPDSSCSFVLKESGLDVKVRNMTTGVFYFDLYPSNLIFFFKTCPYLPDLYRGLVIRSATNAPIRSSQFFLHHG